MTSEEFMSTWSYEGEARPLYGFYDLPNWLDVGGDFRQVEIKSTVGDQTFQTKFNMQTDIEIAVHPSPRVTVVGLWGKYGDAEFWQRRRFYLMTQLRRGQVFRIGRFFPAYGILLDDHARLFRKILGWDQGRESINAEFSLTGEYGELFITRTFGQTTAFDSKRSGQIAVSTDDEQATIIRAARFFTKKFQLGLSYLRGKSAFLRRDSIGLFSLWGIDKNNYLMSQIDRQRDNNIGNTDSFFLRYGYILFRGFHIKLETQYANSSNGQTNAYGYALQWLPRPHWEFLFQYDISYTNGIRQDSTLVLVHYYL